MNRETSKVPYHYITIKTTKSRIDKGLLAIPVSLIELFPKTSSKLLLIEDGKENIKNFTPYSSSSRESRIGGMKAFYEKYNVKNGDELVIQLLDNDKFKIIPEKIFTQQVKQLEQGLEMSSSEDESSIALERIAKVVNKKPMEVIIGEYSRMATENISERKAVTKINLNIREGVPSAMRKILLEIYQGKCQITQFTFQTKNGNPYFEIHHIDPLKGNHFKNLLVVSPNVHAQFTFADLTQKFDNDNWLREVEFNGEKYRVS
ncbi:MAG: HNH endonuclease signature motif containing protein, partial [Chitinophagaceae bacterium]